MAPSDRQSATKILRAAAEATARAQSFDLSLPSVQVTYNAPDTVEQIEHGQSSGTGSSGSETSPGIDAGTSQTTSPLVITQLFIGGHYYEADQPPGERPQFSVAPRSPCNTNTAAATMLNLFRTMARSATASRTANGYRFEVPAEEIGSRVVANAGTATIQDGYIRTVTFGPRGSVGWTISAVNHAPPVTAPSSAMPMNESCGAGNAASPTTSVP